MTFISWLKRPAHRARVSPDKRSPVRLRAEVLETRELLTGVTLIDATQALDARSQRDNANSGSKGKPRLMGHPASAEVSGRKMHTGANGCPKRSVSAGKKSTG